MNRFEQLIEYVINDEQAKARELFHEIVVEKSRQIYEEMMQEEAEEEEIEESAEEEIEESFGGDASDDLIDDIEVEEEGISMEDAGDDEDSLDMSDETGDAELEDRVVDLEDKLDELMAEFESLMGDEGDADGIGDEEDFGDADDMAGDDLAGDDLAGDDMAGDDMAGDDTERMPVGEAISLKSAPAPTKSEEAGINKKSIVAANSGARGAIAKPVSTTGETAQGRPAPSTKDMIGKVQNTPANGSVKLSPAAKPTLSQASGVNTRTPFPKS